MSERLYFIALLPPSEIQKELTGLKQLMAKKYGSRHALNAPPHITLHMPFRWKEKKEQKLFEVVEKINEDVRPFEVELRDFDFFEPRVVFVAVTGSDRLNSLQKKVTDLCRKILHLDNANYRDRPFHPHVTIGFRDLKKHQFYEAKEYFANQKLQIRFRAEKAVLLKHDGEKWQVL